MKRQVLNAATALGLVLAAPSHANLVVNGGFELGMCLSPMTTGPTTSRDG